MDVAITRYCFHSNDSLSREQCELLSKIEHREVVGKAWFETMPNYSIFAFARMMNSPVSVFLDRN